MAEKKRAIHIKLDEELVRQIDEVIKRERMYEGNRSLFVRQGIYVLLSRHGAEPGAQREAA